MLPLNKKQPRPTRHRPGPPALCPLGAPERRSKRGGGGCSCWGLGPALQLTVCTQQPACLLQRPGVSPPGNSRDRQTFRDQPGPAGLELTQKPGSGGGVAQIARLLAQSSARLSLWWDLTHLLKARTHGAWGPCCLGSVFQSVLCCRAEQILGCGWLGHRRVLVGDLGVLSWGPRAGPVP